MNTSGFLSDLSGPNSDPMYNEPQPTDPGETPGGGSGDMCEVFGIPMPCGDVVDTLTPPKEFFKTARSVSMMKSGSSLKNAAEGITKINPFANASADNSRNGRSRSDSDTFMPALMAGRSFTGPLLLFGAGTAAIGLYYFFSR
jgi:hypothetical protein